MAIIGASNSLGGLAGSNALARLLVVISGDSSQLTSALAKSEASLKGFGSNASALGSALTRTITLPFLAIGGAAVKVASDFNYALTRVAALTPILDQSGQSFAQLEQQILDIANQPDVVATPTELANALYFAGSAGLAAADAFQVVELAAKAQSVGMGESADVAKVLIFAMNNYANEGLTAADAMDALTVAIREGTAEPQELAVALGRLLPIAHQAGVSFQEVVASVAALTNLGVPARVATTSLRALFSELLAPTKAATEQLNALGITADQLRFKLQQGPIEAFQLLTDATKGNVDQLRQIIPQIRGITAFYGLSGTALDRYRAIIDNTTNSQGALERVLQQFVKTPTFQFQKALQQLGVAGIELGNSLIPVFLKLVNIIEDVAKVFMSLPGPAKTAFAAFLTLGAAAGPLLKLYGTIAAFGEGGVIALKALSVGFLTAGIAAGAALGGFLSLVHGASSMSSILSTLIGTIVAVGLVLKGLQIAASSSVLGVNLLTYALAGLGGSQIAVIAVTIGAIVTAVGLMAGETARTTKQVEALSDAMATGARSGQSLRDTLNSIADEGVRNELLSLADTLKLLDLPTAQALGALQTGIGTELATQLHAVRTGLDEVGGTGDINGTIIALDDAMQHAAATGGDMGAAFASVNLTDFIKSLQVAAGTSADTAFQDLVGYVSDLAKDFPAAQQAIEDFNDSQMASLQAFTLNSDAVQALADQYGVSVDFITQKLGERGLSGAAVLSNDTLRTEFAKSAFGVDKNMNQISGTVAEKASDISKAMSDMSDAVAGAFNIFEKLPKDTTKSLDVYFNRLQDVNTAQLQLNQDLQNLGRRGIPTDLVAQILGAGGPDLIHKFAAATDKDLKKYVRAFQVNLALGDAAVKREGIHLQTKAKANIEGFAAATVSSGHLTTAAANTIVKNMTAAFISGNLKSTAFDLMIDFVTGLKGAEGITKKQASAAALAFSHELTNSHNFNKDGTLIIHKVAQGIHNATGIPIGKVNEMLTGFITAMKNRQAAVKAQGRLAASAFARGVRNQYDDARQVGGGLMQQLAQGITGGINEVATAAQVAAQKIKQGLHEGLKNSPEYASYYMGIKYANDFTRGMKTVHLERDVEKGLGRLSHTRVASKDMSAGRNHTTRPIRLDRRHVAEELAVDSDYRGW